MPQKPDPGSVTAASSKNFMVTAGELLDFITPSRHGGGARGISADRAINYPNVFGSTLTLAKAKYYLADDEGGAGLTVKPFNFAALEA